jgi:hypothetical protein
VLAGALFLAAEAAARLVWRPSVVGARLYAAFSPTYDYGYAPDVPRMFLEGDSYRFHPTEYVNIRPFSILREKPSEEIRIFVLGGSVSRGSGLREGADYPSRLEADLDAGHPDFEWAVVNLSADGFGTTRMARILTRMVHHRPDVVVLHPHGTNEYEDERDALYREQLREGVNGLLLRSHLLVLLKKAELHVVRTGEQLLDTVDDEETASLDPENNQRWSAMLAANVDRFDCVIRELGVPAIYVGRAERDAKGFRNERVELLNEPIRDAPFFVDAAAALARAATERPGAVLWDDNTHYSELGHAVVARELYELLRPGGAAFDAMSTRPEADELSAEEVAARCLTLQPIRPPAETGVVP